MRKQNDGEQTMAWNEPGGDGNKDPWGKSGNRSNQGPPDLDEVFKNLQKKFGSLFGGKGGGRPDMAQGGATDLSKLEDALASVSEWVAAQ